MKTNCCKMPHSIMELWNCGCRCHDQKPQLCGGCQFEDGQHSLKCPKYVEKDWVEKHISKGREIINKLYPSTINQKPQEECKHEFYVLCNKETCDGIEFVHDLHCRDCDEPSTEHIKPQPLQDCKHEEWNDTAIPGGEYCLNCKLIRAKVPLQGVSEEWEKEFDEMFVYDVKSPMHSDFELANKLKSFIRQLLSAQREELIKELEEMSTCSCYDAGGRCDVCTESIDTKNKHLSDIISKLKESE